jgi:hypothetical protein
MFSEVELVTDGGKFAKMKIIYRVGMFFQGKSPNRKRNGN